MTNHAMYGHSRRFVPLRSLILLLTLLVTGCFGGGKEERLPSSGDPEADRRAEQRVGGGGKDAPDRTLYERLGGEAGIRALVDDLTQRAIADPRVNFKRENIRTSWMGGKYKAWNATPQAVEQLKQRLTQFISLAAGGPAAYSGRDIRTAHRGMKITNNEFDAMVGDIKASMDKLQIAPREQKDLLAIIETTRKQIVEKP